MIAARKGTPKIKQWFKPEQRPKYAPDAPDISVTVLLYDEKYDIHGLGWFNFSTEKWNALEDFYFENGFVWTYLPKPFDSYERRLKARNNG